MGGKRKDEEKISSIGGIEDMRERKKNLHNWYLNGKYYWPITRQIKVRC